MRMRIIVAILLAGILPAKAQDTLTLLRISGDPRTTGRMLSMNAAGVPDGSALRIMAFATDGISKPTKIEILGNNVVIATCPASDSCNYLWPSTRMLAGNNELSMVYTRADGQRFQTYGRIGKPRPYTPTNYLLCPSSIDPLGRCLDGQGNPILAN